MLAEGAWGRRHPTSSATLWIKLLISVNKEKFKPLPPISFPKKNLVETNVSKVLIILWVSHSFFIKFALQTDTLWSNRSSYINWCKISFWKWAYTNPLQYCEVFKTFRDYDDCIVVIMLSVIVRSVYWRPSSIPSTSVPSETCGMHFDKHLIATNLRLAPQKISFVSL